MTIEAVREASWYSELHPRQQALVELSFQLYEREKQINSNLVDYAFIVFPIAKAYEGFLKQFLFDLSLINENTFEGKRFRIGRALNPDINQKQRDEFWLYDDISRYCGEALAKTLWQAWLECRNKVFHYYPLSVTALSLTQAFACVVEVSQAMESAVTCKVEDNHRARH
ncbi:hypothetical protein KBC79_03515 [Candidatus Woesebacteria bacterium]|nr:hypothetical protein [Candidatus Woesebacteria bacterium]